MAGSYLEEVIVPACPRVEVGTTIGTGFLVDTDLVATAAHVIEKGSKPPLLNTTAMTTHCSRLSNQ